MLERPQTLIFTAMPAVVEETHQGVLGEKYALQTCTNNPAQSARPIYANESG